MHEAIGRAVLWAQMFETVFVVCIELVGIMRGKTNALINPNRFKVPTRNLIKELSAANNIAPELEAQINELVEKRHLLVHRWFQENGLPGEESTIEIGRLARLANEVEENSKRISGLLAGYVVRWGKINPERQAHLTDVERNRLLGLFRRAHLGDVTNED